MTIHITKRTPLLLFFGIMATYVAYLLATLLTDVFYEVFVVFGNEIYFVFVAALFMLIFLYGRNFTAVCARHRAFANPLMRSMHAMRYSAFVSISFFPCQRRGAFLR